MLIGYNFLIHRELAKNCQIQVNSAILDSPHTKTLLLFQAHFSHLQLPCADYYTDLKSVLDQSMRILQVILTLNYLFVKNVLNEVFQ